MDFSAVVISGWSEPMGAFLLGFAMMAFIRTVRAAMRWFKKAGTERYD